MAGLSGASAAKTELRHDFERLTLDDINVFVGAVSHVDVALLRILREREVPHRAGGVEAHPVPGHGRVFAEPQGGLRVARVDDERALGRPRADVRRADGVGGRRDGHLARALQLDLTRKTQPLHPRPTTPPAYREG